jgi:hypothetical protein
VVLGKTCLMYPNTSSGASLIFCAECAFGARGAVLRLRAMTMFLSYVL